MISGELLVLIEGPLAVGITLVSRSAQLQVGQYLH